jgi:dimethylglycine dehydrogenase
VVSRDFSGSRMKSHARVAVIGGGIVGCSVLYHLTKLGWQDVALLERKELTAGSSWHAAGGFHALNGDPNVARLQAYTIATYREIEKLSGQDIGIHMCGGINVAATRERWEFLRADIARQRVLGLESRLVGTEEIRELCPIMDVSGIYGGIYDPNEGYLDPAGATHAYAKAARAGGAEIYRHTRVIELKPTSRGSWLVVTEQGTIEAEHVVNAAGLWAREVGAMVGVALPLVPMEHHYLVTDELPELRTLDREIPLTLDLDGEIYLRQEHKGILLGVYEADATPWAVAGTPWDYAETELLPPNLDRIAHAVSNGFARFPSLNAAGIRRVVNGPFTFTPDGNPLVGPLPGLRNCWVACGVMAGFAQGGGVGLCLAEWMIQGEPQSDVFAMDIARFGDFATRAYTHAKAREFYARRFQLAYPNEYWPAARPVKTSALHARLCEANAVHGVSYGLEIPLFIAPEGSLAQETPTLRRSNAFEPVALECRAVREAVGILDSSSFAKYEITGSKCAQWLDGLLAGRMPAVGRIRLAPMLSPQGRLMGDLTLMRVAEDHFMIFGSGYLQTWHMRWFEEHLPSQGVWIRNVSDELAGISLAGPRARELLARVCLDDVGREAFPFMSVRRTEVGGVPATLARLSVTGELGYEIYVAAKFAVPLVSRIGAASEGLGARDIGMYALNALRLEKSYGIWSREFTRDYTPRSSGLWRFVDYDKSQFIGRDAALRDLETVPNRQLVTLEVDSVDADAWGFEPIWHNESLVGFTTSGGFGHTVGKSLAMGYVQSEFAKDAGRLEVSIVGDRVSARVLTEPAVDPAGARMRS